MNKVKLLTLVTFFISGAAMAQTTYGTQTDTTTTRTTTDYGTPTTDTPRTDYGTQTSVTRVEDTDRSLKDEVIGIIPQAGVIGYVDQSGNREARGVAGLGLDVNFASAFDTTRDKDYFLGLSTGAFYSHMGPDNGNFFGDASGRPNGASSANMLLIPANLKVGYNFTPAFRASLRGGGNVMYRSAANAANTGDAFGTDSLWRLYPNAGADLEVQVGRNVSIIARPDVTFTSGPTVLMGTLGATFIPSI